MSTIGIIGGSGLYELDTLDFVREIDRSTPYGHPSAPIRETKNGDDLIYFIPRHGAGHTLLPAEVPYAANVYALKELGVTHILGVSAVGGLQDQFGPGKIVLPDQIIDRTSGRRNTFFGGGIVGHASLGEPTCRRWRGFVASIVESLALEVTNEATYICINGPQFSTRAESNLYRAWGCDIVGMTNATEAKLAAEAGVCYASLCFVTDYDCWKTDEEAVTVEQILTVLHQNVDRSKSIIGTLIEQLGQLPNCTAPGSGQAIVTASELQDQDRMKHLAAVLAPSGVLP